MPNQLSIKYRRQLRPWDMDFICLHLDEAGRFLFFQMDLIDQRHALAVAKKVLAQHGYETGVSTKLLVQVALLHDIGKVSGDLKLWARLLVGLIKRTVPSWRHKWANRQDGAFARACHVDLHHASRGAYMAQTFGLRPEVVEVIRAHHEPPQTGESLLLTYLRESDNRRFLLHMA